MKKFLLILISALLLSAGCAIKVPTSTVALSSSAAVGLNTIVVPSQPVVSEESDLILENMPNRIESTAEPESSIEPAVSVSAFTRNPNFDWALVLVNKDHTLPENFQVELANFSSTRKIDARALSYLQAMINDAKADGIKLNVISSYRSMQRQEELFTAKINEFIDDGNTREEAEIEAAKIVAPPGTSEHGTGLAVDIVSMGWYENNASLTSKFDQTDEFKWLIANCAKYGFILRFPEGKEEITSIDYEPWHYRFVGPENARYIMENNLTLEEFLKLFQS